MPLPWKKVKSTRISQLVNDHLQNSQRRRGDSSLMVETGFPTSLVDLFIKNREKLKKPSKKKREESPPIQFDEPTISRSSPSHMASPSLDLSSMASTSLDPSPLASPLRIPSVLNLPPRSTGGEYGGSGLKRGVDANGIFLAVVKMLLVVVLAFGSKKFALGFTLSAFLLFLVDYVLKIVIGLLKPSLEAQKGLKLGMERVRRIFNFEEHKLVWKKTSIFKSGIGRVDCFSPGYSGLKDCESSFRIQEIQLVGEKCYLPRVQEIQCEEIIDESGFDENLGYEERELKVVVMEKQELTTELSESERKKSRSLKIKSKMKKFIPKKFRSSRRKEHSKSSEIRSIKEDKEHSESSEISPIKEDNITILEEQEAHEYEDVRVESHRKMSSLSSERYDGEDFVAARSELSKGNEVVNLNGEQERTKEGQIWIYFVLCLIVLIGLIGGRIFALFLTLLWCLLLKSGGTLQRYIKVPRIWSFANISS
ncbi:uncharacterized protein Fot_49593 [Forsythia ovata]|uniref:Ethylene-responsive nuclear protein n=1 Tax=Forsythia ovata TaxID=205694 RepID=A0ABD1QDL3_9LAMI